MSKNKRNLKKIAEYQKKYAIGEGLAGEVAGAAAKTVVRDIGEAAAKGIGQSMREVAVNSGRALARSWAEGLAPATKQLVVEMVNSFSNVVKTTVKNKSIFKVLFLAPTENMDKAVKPVLDGVLKKELVNLFDKGFMDGGSEGAKFVKAYIDKEPVQALRTFADPEKLSAFIKNQPWKIEQALKPNQIPGVISKIETQLTDLMAKDAGFAAKMAPSMGAYVGVAKIVTYSQLISLAVDMFDRYKQRNMNLNDKIANLIQELNEMTTVGILPILSDPAFEKQSPQFIAEIKKSVSELSKIAPKLAALESRFITAMSKTADEKQKAATFKISNDSILQAITQLDQIFSDIISYLDQYHRSWSELTTALSVGAQSASVAEKVKTHIGNIKNDIAVYSQELQKDKQNFDTNENGIAPMANASHKSLDVFTKIAIANYIEALKIASNNNGKKKILKLADIYDKIESRQIKKDDPSWIAKQVGPFIMKNFPSLLKDPSRIGAATALLDAYFMKMNTSMGSAIATKLFAPIATRIIGAGAGAAVGTVGAVITGGITAIDMANSITNWAMNNGDISSDVKDIVSALTQLAGTEKTEFKTLCDRVIVKIAGTSYAIQKNADELKKLPMPNKTQITEDDIANAANIMNVITPMFNNFNDLSAGLEILKKKESRDLYIKHSEGIFGMAGRAIDKTVSQVGTLGGILGDRKIGENETGGLNPYNHLMQMIENLEPKLAQIFAGLEPVFKACKEFKNQVDILNQQVQIVSQQLKIDPSLAEELQKA